MFGVKPHGAMWQNAVFLATSRVGVGAASASRATPALVLHVQAAGDDWDAPYGRSLRRLKVAILRPTASTGAVLNLHLVRPLRPTHSYLFHTQLAILALSRAIEPTVQTVNYTCE